MLKPFLNLFMLVISAQSINAYSGSADPTALIEKLRHNPFDSADIVGRDLNTIGLGELGHVGIWTGKSIIEALNETPAIKSSTLEYFKSRSPYWGAVYFSGWSSLPPVTLNVYSDSAYPLEQYQGKLAAVQRARLIFQIGANYTVSPYITPAVPFTCSTKLGCVAPVKGTYRCDTLVKDAYITAGVRGLGYSITDMPSTLWNHNTFSQR